ncbi:hypothetical protein ACFL30_00870 [Candidatus Latescibacterota bacterium]
MKMLPKISLVAGIFVLVVAIVLSISNQNIIAGPNGWLDLALTLAVFSIAFKFVHSEK